MIGDLRTDALHQALADTPIEDDTLFGLLILAFGGDNVTVDSGSDLRGDDRQAICRTLTEGGVLTADRDLLRQAARKMLIGVLSCRENRSHSGPFARIAGEAIGASLLLPNMATEEFLSCLSRGALETVARAEGVNIAPRAKDTRARMVTRFKDGTFVYPGALFRLTPEEQEAAAERAHGRSGTGWVDPVTGEDGEGGEDAEPEAGDEDAAGFDDDPARGRLTRQQRLPWPSRRGRCALSRGHRHDPSLSGWRSHAAAIDAADRPIVIRAAGSAADAADPADRPPPRAPGRTRSRDDRRLRGGGPGHALPDERDLRS